MKSLDINCPSCGSHARLTQSHTYSQTSIGAVFRCSNEACRSEFGGVVTLSASLPPGVERFARQPDSANGQILTDI